jgi:hypothetical protein
MTRISLTSVVYCSLETPAMSAAPYAHQWQTKPNILGLNLSPATILISTPIRIVIPAPYQVRGKLQPESRTFKTFWMPDQVRHDGKGSLWTDTH